MTEQTKSTPTEITPEHIQALFDLMIADYHRWSFGRKSMFFSEVSETEMAIREQMFEEYKAKLRYEVNPKYIRLVSDNSVVGFIVNVHDDKDFPFGTLLYPKGLSGRDCQHYVKEK